MSLGYNTKRGIFGLQQAGGGIFNNAISGLGAVGALGDYYNGGLDASVTRAKNAAANANAYSAKVKSASDSSVGIPIFRTATQFVQSAHKYADDAGNEFNSTNWQSATDQGTAAALVQSAINAVKVADANLAAAGTALAKLPKPPVPKAFTDVINAAKAQAASASIYAAKARTFKTAKDAQNTLNAANAFCSSASAYVQQAGAMYGAVDFSKELSDEDDWILLGKSAEAARDKGCGDVQSAVQYVGNLPATVPGGGAIAPNYVPPKPPVNVTPTYVPPSKPPVSTASMLVTGGVIAAAGGGLYYIGKKKGWFK